MNFKSMTLKAAALATLSVASAAAFTAPSQAAIVAGDRLQIDNIIRSNVKVLGSGLNTAAPIITGLDFNNGKIQVTGATNSSGVEGAGGFASYIGGFTKDLTFAGGVSGPVVKFLSFNSPNSPNLFFDLTKAIVRVDPFSAGQRSINVDLFGNFTNSSGSILGVGEGGLNTYLDLFRKNKKSPWEATPGTYHISIKAIPTPALLPGLLGLGVAALRKRKSEESDVEAAQTAKA